MKEVIDLAYELAEQAHDGQRYGPFDYLAGHVITVMWEADAIARSMALGPYDRELVKTTAVLHDTPEDGPLTAQAVKSRLIAVAVSETDAVFGRDVGNGVRALTKPEALEYDEYMEALLALRPNGWLPQVVKLADLRTNLNHGVAHLRREGKDARADRLVAKYTPWIPKFEQKLHLP